MMTLSRRAFVKSLSAGIGAAALGLPQIARPADSASKIKLGLDNFSVRALGWNAEELIDYAASLKTDSLFISDLKPFSSHSDDYLKTIRSKAAYKGIQIHLGSWSICPTARTLK